MQVDWFTTAAQFVNFFVLVWLLRRFLYTPVAAAIARRQKALADGFADADAATAAARSAEADYAARAASLAAEADAIRARARAEAATLICASFHVRKWISRYAVPG